MQVADFENKRWSTTRQSVEFRHGKALSLIEGKRILDLGCGDGLFLDMVRNRGLEGVGLDASPEAVARCREKGLEAQVWSLGEPIPYEANSFDTVVLLDVLEHVYDPSALLREAARVSKEPMVISVPNFSSLPARLQTLVGEVPENNRPHKGHLYWFNYAVLKRVAHEADCHIESLHINTFFPFSLCGSFFPKIWPQMFALSFVAVLRKV